MIDKLTCNCCNTNEAIGVASSSLGAMSFAYCRQCLDENADCEIMFQCAIDMVDGDENELSDHIKSMKTFKNGKYVNWTDWLKTYKPTVYK